MSLPLSLTHRSVRLLCQLLLVTSPLVGFSQTSSGWLRSQGITFKVTPYVGILKKLIDGATHPGIRFDTWVKQIDASQGADYHGKKYYPSDFDGQLRSYFDGIEIRGINGRADLNIGAGQTRVKDFVTFYDLGPTGESYSVVTSLRKDEDVVIARVNITGGQLIGVDALWSKIDELEKIERERKKQQEAEERERLKREAERKAADEAARKAAEKAAAEKTTSAVRSGSSNSPSTKMTNATEERQSNSNQPSSVSKNTNSATNRQATNATPQGVARDNNGNYYQQYSDGTYRPISREAYDQARQAKAEEKATAQAAEKKRADQRYVDSAITALNASSNKMLEYNRRSQEESERTRNLIGQNFYAAQQLSEAKSNFQQQSKLQDRYSSVDELERDYQQKLSGVSGAANQLANAKNQSLQSNYEYQFRDADESGKALGQAVVGIGSMINSISADKQAEKARRELADARASALKKMEKERKESLIAARKKLLADFPEGGTPLSSHRVSTNEVYLFAYSINPAKLEEDAPSMSVTNVFPVGKRNDGTWPFKSSIVGDLGRIAMSQPITIFGYFASKEKAEEWNAAFKRMANQSGIRIQALNYSGKPSSARSGSATENKDSNTDFFGNPIKGAENKSTPNNEPKKTKLDFFGNPIKE